MRKIIITAATAVAAGLLTTACGTSTPQQGNGPINGNGTTPAPAAVAQPANPVPILKMTGAHVPAGMKLGDHDVLGDRMAEGTMGPGGYESVTVYTAASKQAQTVMMAHQAPQPDDGTGVIVSRRGLILTAYHVLGEDSDYFVTTSDRKVYRASVKAADPRSDPDGRRIRQQRAEAAGHPVDVIRRAAVVLADLVEAHGL